MPGIVFEEMTAAAICAPSAAPTVRMIVFIPVATPVSRGAEFAITRAPSDANENAMPTPNSVIQA